MLTAYCGKMLPSPSVLWTQPNISSPVTADSCGSLELFCGILLQCLYLPILKSYLSQPCESFSINSCQNIPQSKYHA